MNKVTVEIDKLVLQEALRLYDEHLASQAVKSLEAALGCRFTVHYKKNNHNLLSWLCDKYGSDKGEIKKYGHPYPWPSHTYADLYSRLFDHCRFGVTNVFECGIGSNNPNILSSMGVEGKPGASLRVWRDYFPNAHVFGSDIDKDVLFVEERIKTFYVDQTNPKAIGDLWKEVGVNDFDFMVDDGLHTFEAGLCLFENSVSKLSKYGVYIIEDVNVFNLAKYKDYFDNKEYQVDYVSLFQQDLSPADNNIVVIRYVQSYSM
jgi:hypothetical protein